MITKIFTSHLTALCELQTELRCIWLMDFFRLFKVWELCRVVAELEFSSFLAIAKRYKKRLKLCEIAFKLFYLYPHFRISLFLFRRPPLDGTVGGSCIFGLSSEDDLKILLNKFFILSDNLYNFNVQGLEKQFWSRLLLVFIAQRLVCWVLASPLIN